MNLTFLSRHAAEKVAQRRAYRPHEVTTDWCFAPALAMPRPTDRYGAENLAELTKLPGFVYVGTPYTNFPAGRDEAFRLAALYAGRLMQRGLRVFSPIAHSHPIAREAGLDETDHELWVRADAPFVEAASAIIVVLMDGWRISRGLAHEIEAFRAAGKPIVYLSPEEILA